MNTKLAFLSVFFMLFTNISLCLAQDINESEHSANADTTKNIAKKRGLFKKKEHKKEKEITAYQLSDEEIRLRSADPNSLSKKERKKLDKSYKKEAKHYKKNGMQSDSSLTQNFLRQNPQYEGMNLNENDIRTLTRINKKYALTPEEQRLRMSNPDTLGLFQHIKIARTYRKEYKRKKKIEKFWKKKIYSMQPPDAKERMKAQAKKTKQRDRRRKWQMRKKRFLNLFR